MASNYIPSAGYMYDLLFMYKLYFNKGEWMTEFVLHKKAEQNRDFYVAIMKLFDTAPEEGALFFYVKDALSCVRLSTIRFVLLTFAVARLNLLSYVCTA